jgi:hypothetical protein
METVKKPARAVNKKAAKNKVEEPIIEASIVKEEETSHEEFRTASENTLKAEGNSHIKSTADINLEQSKEETDSAKVNFMDDNFMESLLNKKTEQSEEQTKGAEKGDSKGSGEDANVSSVDVTPDANAFTKDDMMDFAEVFMDILDMGISTALKFYSKDTSTAAYELSADKKRRLVRQLTNLFMKYQMKFSLEFMFIVTLLICYSVPIAKAKKTRKEIKEGTFRRESGKPSK